MLIAVLAGAAVLSLALLLWWRRRPRALPLDRIEIPCASCWRPTAFGALVGGRCLDCRLAPFFAEIAAHAHEPPRPAYDVPAPTCMDCRVALPPAHPWHYCMTCMSARVTAAYLARTTRRQLTVSEDELRRIWDRVAW